MFSAIAILAIITAGLLHILGITKYTKRLLLFGIVLAFVAPLLLESLTQLSTGVLGWQIDGLSIFLLIGLIFFAYSRFRSRQRQNQLLRQQFTRPTSFKRRIDRDQF